MRDEILTARAVVLGAAVLALIGAGTSLLVGWIVTACGICWRHGCPGGHDDEILAEMLAQRPVAALPVDLRHALDLAADGRRHAARSSPSGDPPPLRIHVTAHDDRGDRAP